MLGLYHNLVQDTHFDCNVRTLAAKFNLIPHHAGSFRVPAGLAGLKRGATTCDSY